METSTEQESVYLQFYTKNRSDELREAVKEANKKLFDAAKNTTIVEMGLASALVRTPDDSECIQHLKAMTTPEQLLLVEEMMKGK